MGSTDILAYMRRTPKEVFTLSELAEALGMRKNSLAVALNRLVKRGIIIKGFRGQYINPFVSYRSTKLAVEYKKPAYISMEYALSGDILPQICYVITVVTTRKVHTSRIAQKKGYSWGQVRFGNDFVEYHQISPRLFWGYELKADGIPVAVPEKALLDLIYLRYLKTRRWNMTTLLSLLDDMYLCDVDKNKLYKYAEKFGLSMLRFIRKLDADGWLDHQPER